MRLLMRGLVQTRISPILFHRQRQMGHVKRKSAFEYAQNLRIHMILHMRMRKASSGQFALH